MIRSLYSVVSGPKFTKLFLSNAREITVENEPVRF